MNQVVKIVILTPVKDAVDHLDGYFSALEQLDYPKRLLSLGFLESDSEDSTFDDLRRRLPGLRRRYRRVGLWKKDFSYRVPDGLPRHDEEIQPDRRRVLALSRNHLLLHALDDEDFVLWLDVDVNDYPADILRRLLATGKDIVEPNCVKEYGGPTYDLNAWRDHGRLHLDDLRREGDLVPLDGVGGTMLFVRADAHRDGLNYPPFYYGVVNPYCRPGRGEIETEGLGCMARDMGYQAWGMPNLEVRHTRNLYPKYTRLVSRIKAVVQQAVPSGSTVLVISKGDDALTALDGMKGLHFPSGEDGAYPGYYPADSVAAIDALERQRGRGAQFLAIPVTALWWLDHYQALADHIQRRYPRIADDRDTCVIFDLREAGR
jgi:Anp1